jgi:hypothetical protein
MLILLDNSHEFSTKEVKKKGLKSGNKDQAAILEGSTSMM